MKEFYIRASAGGCRRLYSKLHFTIELNIHRGTSTCMCLRATPPAPLTVTPPRVVVVGKVIGRVRTHRPLRDVASFSTAGSTN